MDYVDFIVYVVILIICAFLFDIIYMITYPADVKVKPVNDNLSQNTVCEARSEMDRVGFVRDVRNIITEFWYEEQYKLTETALSQRTIERCSWRELLVGLTLLKHYSVFKYRWLNLDRVCKYVHIILNKHFQPVGNTLISRKFIESAVQKLASIEFLDYRLKEIDNSDAGFL